MASPLDFNPSYPHYWSADSQDALFGAHHNSLSTHFTGFSVCPPIYDDHTKVRCSLTFATFSKEPLLLFTSSFWVWAAPSTTLPLWSLSRNLVLILKELRSLPPSSMCTLWTLLLNCVFRWSYSLFSCVGTQKGCAGHCLLVGRGGKFDLLRVWTTPHVFDYIGCLFSIS